MSNLPGWSWKDVAVLLASRLEHHDYCPDQHPDPADFAHSCPFCADRAALAKFRQKRGTR